MSFIANKLIRGSSIIDSQIDRLLFLTQPFQTVYVNGSDFTSVSASSSGQYRVYNNRLGQGNPNVGTWVSNDYGKTWANRYGAEVFIVTCSQDGQVMYSTSINYQRLISTNYGVNWSVCDGTSLVINYGISTNSNGSKCLVGTFSGSGTIKVTSDTGTTWTNLSTLPNSSAMVRDSSMSSDGNTIVINNTSIWKTSNFGSSWIQIANMHASIAMSGDATKIILGNTVNDYLKVSTNSGTSFNDITTLGQRIWGRVAMSEDGTKMMARDQNNFVFLSTNSGSTWANYPI